MKSWTKLIVMWVVAGWLGLAGAANAEQVKTIASQWGGAGTVAVRSDGVLFGWGSARNPSTTPLWMNQNVLSVTGDINWTLLTDGTVFNLNWNVPVTGLSSVQAVHPSPGYIPSMNEQAGWLILNNGKTHPFVQVQGLSGTQTFSQGFGLGLGLSGVAVVPRRNVWGTMDTSWAWGIDTSGTLWVGQSTFTGSGLSNVATSVAGLSNVTGVVDFNNNHDTFVVKSDGTVWAWGSDIAANGAFNNQCFSCNLSVPPTGVSGVSAVQVTGLANVVSLSVGQGSIYAVTATGNVWAWGQDYYGQLGNNQNTNNGFASLPQQVLGLTNVMSVHAAGASVLALRGDGSVWGWGDNFYGQLGDGSNIGRMAPVPVGGLSPITGVTSLDISAGYLSATNPMLNTGSYVVAAKSDGSVWTWGDNNVGQLGNGTRVASSVPVPVLGDGGVGFMSVEPAILDVLANGVSVLNNQNWHGFVFPGTNVGSPSAAQTMGFKNNGMVAWTGFSFAASNGDFAQNNNCGATLLPGASCTVNITFTPTRAGLQTVPMSGGSMGNSQIGGTGGLTLSGTGLGPQAVLSASLGFGTQKTTITTTKVVTLTNAGSASLTLGATSAPGTGFSVTSDTCTGATLTAGTSCTMSVNFTPALVQAYAGTLTFASSNNPGGIPSMALSGTGAAAAAVRSDFDANGKADILWRDLTTGQNVLWFMNGTTLSSFAYAASAGVDWTAVGLSDFAGDGKSDILWSNQTTGLNVLWFMNAQNILSASALNTVNPSWRVAGVGDFNGDGKQGDILWYNASTGQVAVWLTNASGQLVSAGLVGTVAQGWSIAGVGDFNGDGKSDVLLRNAMSGADVIWFMNGTSILQSSAIPTAASIWSVKGVADFNGDGKADVFWVNSSGDTYVWLMNGSTLSSFAPSYSVGLVWAPVKFADFNGDGKTDILWRDASGNDSIWLMNGLTLPTFGATYSAATNWTVINK